MSDRCDLVLARVERLERRLRRWRMLAVVVVTGTVVAGAATSCQGDRHEAPAAQPFVLKSVDGKESIELTARGLVVTAADGRRTEIEGGHVLLASGPQRIELTATASESAVRLLIQDGSSVTPDITLRVSASGTPASLLMADHKARNFNHLYINGAAGLEMAGVREYKNFSIP